MNRNLIYITLFFLIFFVGSNAFSWSEKSHKEISRRAINLSQLSRYMEDQLGLYLARSKFRGPGQLFESEFGITPTYTINEWLLHGAEAEDELLTTILLYHYILIGNYDIRADNHFYNPFWDNLSLYPWGHEWIFQKGGLYDIPDLALGTGGRDLCKGKPSPRWANDGCSDSPPYSDFTRSADNFFSWVYAKKYFYAALSGDSTDLDGILGITGKVNMNERERGRCFALLFRSLGQLMHLIQDAGVPEHTRNDAHPFSGRWGFEKYAEKQYFDSSSWSAFSVSPDLIAKSSIPILDFFDADRSGGGYSSSSTGLAEFSNFNFLTKDSIANNVMYEYCAPNCEPHGHERNRFFTHPMINESEASLEPGRVYHTYYYWSENIVDPLGIIPTQSIKLAKRNWYHNLLVLYGWSDYSTEDENIWNDYLSLLVPKCIAYSSAMLDYFFRGNIDMVRDEETVSGYVILNKSEEDMEGLFELYYDNETDQRRKLWEQNFTLGAAGSGDDKSSNIYFNEPSDAKDPGKYMLVFRGRLGREPDAVTGKTVEIVNSLKFYIRLNGDAPTKKKRIRYNDIIGNDGIYTTSDATPDYVDLTGLGLTLPITVDLNAYNPGTNEELFSFWTPCSASEWDVRQIPVNWISCGSFSGKMLDVDMRYAAGPSDNYRQILFTRGSWKTMDGTTYVDFNNLKTIKETNNWKFPSSYFNCEGCSLGITTGVVTAYVSKIRSIGQCGFSGCDEQGFCEQNPDVLRCGSYANHADKEASYITQPVIITDELGRNPQFPTQHVNTLLYVETLGLVDTAEETYICSVEYNQYFPWDTYVYEMADTPPDRF